MKIFKKDGQPQLTKLQKRISGLPTYEISVWAENYLAEAGQLIAGLGPKTPERFEEAIKSIEIVLDLIRELHKRSHE